MTQLTQDKHDHFMKIANYIFIYSISIVFAVLIGSIYGIMSSSKIAHSEFSISSFIVITTIVSIYSIVPFSISYITLMIMRFSKASHVLNFASSVTLFIITLLSSSRDHLDSVSAFTVAAMAYIVSSITILANAYWKMSIIEEYVTNSCKCKISGSSSSGNYSTIILSLVFFIISLVFGIISYDLYIALNVFWAVKPSWGDFYLSFLATLAAFCVGAFLLYRYIRKDS